MIDKGICDKGFIWNPSNCECECDKSCDVGKFLNYKNCKYRKRLIDKLAEECSEDINGNEMIYNYDKVCSSCTIYKMLLVIFFIISICISSAFIHLHWCLKRSNAGVNIEAGTY